MFSSKERKEELKAMKELLANANPLLSIVGRGLVTLSDDESEDSEEYKELMESSEEILNNEPISEPPR